MKRAIETETTFLNSYTCFLRASLGNTKRELDQEKEQSAEFFTKLLASEAKILTLEKFIASQGSDFIKNKDKIKEQYKYLKKHAFLRDFTFINTNQQSKLKLFTKSVKMADPDSEKEVMLPEYDITLDLITGDMRFSCDMRRRFNKSWFKDKRENNGANTESDFDGNEITYNRTINIHPHIFTDGRACLGNFLEIYKKLLLTGEYGQIVDIVFEYVRTYNPDSPALSFTDFIKINKGTIRNNENE